MRSVLKDATLMAALLLIGGAPARAAVVDAHVPFPFMVRGQQFPAGEYRLHSDEADPSVIWISGEHGNIARMVVMTTQAPGKDPAGDTPALTFLHRENQYRLADVWESVSQGHEILPARGVAAAQTSAQKSTAKHGSTPPAKTLATMGIVKSMDDSTLVIARSDASHSEMTFAVNTSTHRHGTISAGTSVSVRYHEDGQSKVATDVRAEAGKHVSHTASSKS